MKKFLFLLCAVCLFTSCKTIDNIQKSAVNCKYTLIGAQTSDFSLSDISLDVALAITNMDRSEVAKMNRFEGKLYVNNNEISDITFGSYQIIPGDTVLTQAHLTVPFNKVGKNIAGLVTMNSVAVKYKIAGIIYFDTPAGELPFPIVVEQQRKD